MEEAAAPAETSALHDVHELARLAAELEAETEKLFDETLIADIQETPLVTLDAVLEEREEAKERRDRVAGRAKEMLEEELAKERHEREVKDLEEAISVTQKPIAKATTAAARKPPSASAPAAASPEPEEEVPPTAPFELASANVRANVREREANPYVLNLTEFVPETEATRQARDLRKETELLKACLADAKQRPNAFESYLKRGASTHAAL